MSIKNIAAKLVSTGLVLLLAGAPSVQAQSACKGLSSGQCSVNNDCVWVGGYTRKDNRKVSGYCRSKGNKGNTPARDTGSASTRTKGQKTSSARDKGSADSRTKGQRASTERDKGSASKRSSPETKDKKSKAKRSKGGDKEAKSKKQEKTKKKDRSKKSAKTEQR